MNQSNKNHSSANTEVVALNRNLGLFTITMIGVGGMIGAGIFVLTGIAAGVAGPALILVFLLNGLVTLFTAMAYAELGSAFPEAGGGYLWVKEGLGGVQGFLAGWMSWFAHAMAGSLYALAFGRFFTEFWQMGNMPMFGLSVDHMTLLWMTVIIIIFTAINYRGSSETGAVGNFVTLTKIVVLGFFALFGLIVMFHNPDWPSRFTDDFLPNGTLSIFVAMGLTFIAFEGYEIISQSGEEAINPHRNIPRAIFLSIGIAVTIYVLISVTAIGATIAPAGMQAYQYLGQKGEVAIVEVAQQIFPLGIGGIILLISGLISTMSALNATTYSSSRVSFAMGRDHNLPSFFAEIHPKRHTPHWAILASGGLMIAMAWALPLQSVAAAADIMFLLLFIQVNIAVMILRQKMPELNRGFRVPWIHFIPLLAVFCNGLLVLYLFTFSPIAWFTAVGWIVIGLLAYYSHFAKIEAMEKPKVILHEEVLVSRDYSVIIPVDSQEQARILGNIGSILAASNQGEVLALNVLNVPTQITLSQGRLFLKESRPLLDAIIEVAKTHNVPVHTIVRLGGRPVDAIRKTALENASDLIVLGWSGYTGSSGRLFGSVIDPIVDDPPTDIAVVRFRQQRPLHTILVPVGGGLNCRRAMKMAVQMAKQEPEGAATVVAIHVVPPGTRNGDLVRARQAFSEALTGVDYENIEQRIVEGTDVVETILREARETENHPESDLIIIGATHESVIKNLLVGNIPEQIARRASVTVIMVKRRNSAFHSFLHKVALTPNLQPEITKNVET
jgi:amino acid transporter/nucleotide-binding universal stress UspA family protein